MRPPTCCRRNPSAHSCAASGQNDKNERPILQSAVRSPQSDVAHSPSILIVEDSPTQAELLRDVLETHGYHVSVAADGAEALAAMGQHPPALVITDVVMPEMGGYELCRKLKADERFHAIPLILLTSLADSQAVLEGLACGADSFIPRPYSQEYLLSHVGQTLAQQPSRNRGGGRVELEIPGAGEKRHLTADPQQMLTLLLSTYEAAVSQNAELTRTQDEMRVFNERLESLVEERTAALSAEITERKRAAEALLQSEHNFRGSLENSLDGILVVNCSGQIVFANLAAADIFGQSQEQLLGSAFGYPMISGQNTELDVVNSSGRTAIVEMRMAQTVWEGTLSCVISLRDITQRKHSEQQLRFGDEELKRANQNLVERNAEIQKFYHTLSHELKTPLTSAREFISILIDGLAGPLNETQMEYLGIAKESCDQLRLYLTDMLDVTRLETGKMSLDFQTGPLGSLVETVVKMLAPAAEGKKLSLSCDCQPDLPDIPFDKQRILQVITNLITNAIKFTPAGGLVCLGLSEAPADSECLQVVVRDTGRGIPASNHEE